MQEKKIVKKREGFLARLTPRPFRTSASKIRRIEAGPNERARLKLEDAKLAGGRIEAILCVGGTFCEYLLCHCLLPTSLLTKL
jgi:hypothetical protein